MRFIYLFLISISSAFTNMILVDYPNLRKISLNTMLKKNDYIKKIYVRSNKDLILHFNNDNFFYYHNKNKSNVYLEFSCDFSFISEKYLEFLNKTKAFHVHNTDYE